MRLNGLPAGVKTEPATVAAGTTDFVIRIVAEAKAAAGSTAAQLVLAYQVSKKDYPTPPLPLNVKVLTVK